MSSPVLLVLGAGPNVGLAVARKFAKQGYKVALAARNPNDEVSKAADLVLKADFSDPSAVVSTFDKVKEKLGIPTVVVYNAYSVHLTPEDPFSISVTDFNTDMVVNTTSAFAAAQEATRGFDQLPADASKTFIFTGNNLNIPGRRLLVATSSGTGKSATAHFIANAASANLSKGYKYYYADERTPEGETVKFDNSGDAHGEFYYDLAQDPKQGAWLATFVKGKGYVDFSATDRGY
ncbi:putative short chain type dehydrogenase [Neolentinus lepideus HHB14362 ss-1]|uniref:Putative short chain type dehydrogenase n=1 Tax=Neolentinus lepideus HHB14362 ss-1 TaxID=1314782 RepID=A0A165SEC4_9AGAM|nr:putative short chain type dehydrogenase [Neolentinus lepideus HHB14362 ss-1]